MKCKYISDNIYQVVVPKTLKATMVLRNMSEIEQVIIRGIQESKLLDKEVIS